MKKLGRDAAKLETINLFSLLQDDDGGALYVPSINLQIEDERVSSHRLLKTCLRVSYAERSSLL